jgi:CDP-diacylglycerol--glycerol-3-phosphate 3-phosphatidyltransferase
MITEGPRVAEALNFPNALTLARILLIPVFILSIVSSLEYGLLIATAIFLAASATDALDGYIARRRSQVTTLGRLLDPVADKLLVMAALFLLVDMDRVAAWVAIVIVGREFAVTALRALAASQGLVMSADTTGKFKMILQIVAIVLLLLQDEPITFIDLHVWGSLCLYASMILALVSGIQYAAQLWKHMTTSPH